MQPRFRAAVLLMMMGGASLAIASSSPPMRPGLWEITTTSDLLRLVPAIPPDQMQGLMNLARQHGFDMPAINNGAATARVCVTPEMAQQDTPAVLYQRQSGCATRNASRAGNAYRMDFVCKSSHVTGNGKADGTFASPEQFSGRTSFDGAVEGNPVNEHADVGGRWVQASCGAVKPLQ